LKIHTDNSDSFVAVLTIPPNKYDVADDRKEDADTRCLALIQDKWSTRHLQNQRQEYILKEENLSAHWVDWHEADPWRIPKVAKFLETVVLVK
jgi:hypothetical protein